MERKNARKVGYVFDRRLLTLVNRLPQVKGRAALVHSLIGAYGLLRYCHRIDSQGCTRDELRKFHSEDFVEFVVKQSDAEDSTSVATDEEEMFGFGYDCPLIDDLYETISHLAGASVAAARAIISRRCQVAINWCGGWHHAHRDEVSGFCYTNDIVFAILELLDAGYRRVLYIDLDLHHGDGVEDAFAHTNKVVTLSFHKHELGFYPGTGGLSPANRDERTRFSAINVPLSDGLDDTQMANVFHTVINDLVHQISPDVLVCQCGADTLSGDRMRSFVLTLDSVRKCTQTLLNFELPTLLLGGGGYNLPNAARLWTSITADALGVELSDEIPEHEHLLHYGPTYELSIIGATRTNHNDEHDLRRKLSVIKQNIARLSPSLSFSLPLPSSHSHHESS